MLALPILVGAVLRVRAGAPSAPVLLPIVACWFTGYLAFSATSGWLKAPPRRRRAAVPPVLTWAGVAAGFGLVALLVRGPELLGWVAGFGPLIGAALWLVATRRERSFTSGALTVVAAALMTLVVRFVTPQELLAAWGTPAGTVAVAQAALVLGYLVGTVLAVKTMIRERGKPGWVAASIGWHLAVAVLAGWLSASGVLGPGWLLLFVAVGIRAAVMPLLASRQPLRPLIVGLVEIVLTVAFVGVAALG